VSRYRSRWNGASPCTRALCHQPHPPDCCIPQQCPPARWHVSCTHPPPAQPGGGFSFARPPWQGSRRSLAACLARPRLPFCPHALQRSAAQRSPPDVLQRGCAVHVCSSHEPWQVDDFRPQCHPPTCLPNVACVRAAQALAGLITFSAAVCVGPASFGRLLLFTPTLTHCFRSLLGAPTTLGGTG
jgi:hypothetical protein